MENMDVDVPPPNEGNVAGVQGVNANAANTSEAPPTAPTNKRKGSTRSIVWGHFHKVFDKNGKMTHAKCIYCAQVYVCESKKHGTSSLRGHMTSCLKNPQSIDTRQALLNFKPASESGEGVLGTWVFDQEKVRRALDEMVIIDELAFRFVEGEGFKKFIAVACPRFKIPSRWTVSRDIYSIYEDERLKLKQFFRGSSQRVSITTDTWTSIQQINYMCITAHFIDNEWKLQKRIVSFVPVSSHKAEYIAQALESCLLEWGLRNVFSVTVDNASSNDTAMGFFKNKLLSWGSSAVKTKYLHMRCIAHILNLVVQDGLRESVSSVKKIREAIKFVKASPSRLKRFRDMCDLVGIQSKSALCLDVSTRWNSTYLMLETAIIYQRAFEAYEGQDRDFRADLGNSVPDFIDWHNVTTLVRHLKVFYDVTLRISGSLYVTCNNFFTEISDLSCLLSEMLQSQSESKIYFEKVIAGLKELFEDYVSTYVVASQPTAPVTNLQPVQADSSIGRQSRLKAQLRDQFFNFQNIGITFIIET